MKSNLLRAISFNLNCLKRPGIGLLFSVAIFSLSPSSVWAQAPTVEEQNEEITKQKAIVDRFVTVLERNPRRGTSLDKIYGFHIENGTIDKLVAQYQERTV